MHAGNREYLLKEFADLVAEKQTTAKVVCAQNKGDNYTYIHNSVAKK